MVDITELIQIVCLKKSHCIVIKGIKQNTWWFKCHSSIAFPRAAPFTTPSGWSTSATVKLDAVLRWSSLSQPVCIELLVLLSWFNSQEMLHEWALWVFESIFLRGTMKALLLGDEGYRRRCCKWIIHLWLKTWHQLKTLRNCPLYGLLCLIFVLLFLFNCEKKLCFFVICCHIIV